MRNFFSKLHLWLSVPFGLVITVTCFSGAMLVLEKEITDVYYDDLIDVEPSGQPLSLDVIAEKVNYDCQAGAEISGFVLSGDDEKAYKLNFSKPKRTTLYVNQYTGAVNGEYSRLPFFRSMLRLHRWLMDNNPGRGSVFFGKMIVGASTLAFVVLLVTGIVLWWPCNRKMLKNRLRVAVGKGKNRFWYDLHVAGGFYALFFLLAMALTGLTWSYKWYSKGFYTLLGAGDGATKSLVEKIEPQKSSGADSVGAAANIDGTTGATSSPAYSVIDATTGATAQVGVDALTSATQKSETVDGTSGATSLSSVVKYSPYTAWNKALKNVLERYPEYSQITVGDGTITVQLNHFGNQRASDRYTFDTANGDLKTVQYYCNNSNLSRMRGLVYSIHVGSWGGIATKVLYFFVAILGASLPLTGYYLWIRRLYIKRKKNK